MNMRMGLRDSAWILVAVLALAAAARAANDATAAITSEQEEEANRAMWSIKPEGSADEVRRQVDDFLDKYPGSQRRREVRSRLVQAYVRSGRFSEAVDECMHQAVCFAGNRWGERILTDDLLHLADFLAAQGNPGGAASVRLHVCLNFPYQLEHRRQFVLAVEELAKTGRDHDVLAFGKLALALVPESESAGVVKVVKESLTRLRGTQAAERFEAYWNQGPADQGGQSVDAREDAGPLAEVRGPQLDNLRKVAQRLLASKGLLDEGGPAQAMQRGLLHILAGDRQEAAMDLQEAVTMSSPDQKDASADQAGAYFRWFDGSCARARRYRAFVRLGAAGKDGVAGTPDDLANPFLDPVSVPSHGG